MFTSRESFTTVISEVYRLAIFTNCAAARAWSPSSLLIKKVFDVSPAASLCGSAGAFEDFSGERDIFLAIFPDERGDLRQRSLPPKTR